MRSASKLIPLLFAAALIGACEQERSDQNIAIDNNAAAADIEALPPDESSATSTDELENGVDGNEAGVNDGANLL